MKKNIEILEKITAELLEKMSVKADSEVAFEKDGDVYSVDIKSGEETGLLIGKRGENLSSIQTLLTILFKEKTGEWNKVVVNVGDYRQKEEDYLTGLAQSAVQRAKETGEPQSLYNLLPWQRRVVHVALSNDPDVVTESEGEGVDRHLIVKLKK